jgi:hypothetical protein
MPCDVLIRNNVHSGGRIDYAHSDPDKDKRGVYKKGYPVSMLDAPRVHRGYMEGLPYSVAVNITDASVAQVEAMIASTFSEESMIQDWARKIDFATVNSNLTIDGWRLRVFATNPGANDFAGITQLMVENYLTRWNAEVFSAATNEVVFDVAIFEDAVSVPGALQSEGFWGIVPTGVVFIENSYIEGTGVHEIEADYSGSSFSSHQVQNRIEDRGGVVLSNTAGVATFTINRTDVFQWFQEEVKRALERTVFRRQFRIPEATVDTIISTGTQILVDHYYDDAQTQFRGQVEYRVLDRTLAQVEAFLINRLDETIT